MDTIDSLKYEELTPEQQEFVDLVGLEMFKEIVCAYGGTNLYIPRIDTLGRTSRNAQIKAEFDGYNFKQLARKHSMSEVWIRKIVAE